MQLYSKFLRHLEVKDGDVYPRPNIQSMLRETTLDYDLMSEVEDLFRLGDNTKAMEKSIDLMLSQNEPMMQLHRGLKETLEHVEGVRFTEVHGFIDGLEVKRLKSGGMMSKLPLIGVLYSYDIHCFAARLSIYLEDVVENQKKVKYNYGKIKAFTVTASRLLTELRVGLRDLLSMASGFESVLFNTLFGKNVTTWLVKTSVQSAIHSYNQLIDTSLDVRRFIAIVEEAKSLMEQVLGVVELGTNSVYLEGVYPIAKGFESLQNRDVFMDYSKDKKFFLESKGDGERVVIYTNPLEAQLKQIRRDAETVDVQLGGLKNAFSHVLSDAEGVKLAVVNL